jgi:RNA polymerase sigma factor (sigma-70 family)
MSQFTGAVLKELHRVFDHGTVAGLNEGALLERFVAGRDEAAFAALVARHGPMVLGVCRRILHDEQDVDDAFQATFLVLVRRASAIRQGNLVGHWLHVVAHKVAVRARAHAARRHRRESAALTLDLTNSRPASAAALQWELREILDEELARLPSSLRMPVVLCYLEGLTHDEAAVRLDWPVGTVRSRMSRARDVLRRRLTRRGLAADGPALATSLFRPPLPAGLIDSTVRSCLSLLPSQVVAGGALSSTAAVLARGVIHAMTISKLKIVSTAALAGVLALSGVQTLARQLGGERSGMPREPRATPSQEGRRAPRPTTYARIEKVLGDLETQNHDVLMGLDSLRKEVAALRASEALDRPVSSLAPADKTGACPAQMIGNCISCHLTGQHQPQITRGAGGDLGSIQGQAAGEVNADAAIHLTKPRNDAIPYYDLGELILVASRQGDRVAVYQKLTGQSMSLRLPVAEGSRHDVGYKLQGSTLALSIKGPKIKQIAVFENAQGAGQGWYAQDLREPVDQAVPRQVINRVTIYALGRHVYAYSGFVRRWDVLTLPEGEEASPDVDKHQTTNVVRSRGHLYMFSAASGKWHDVDLSAILNAPPGEPKEHAPGFQW